MLSDRRGLFLGVALLAKRIDKKRIISIRRRLNRRTHRNLWISGCSHIGTRDHPTQKDLATAANSVRRAVDVVRAAIAVKIAAYVATFSINPISVVRENKRLSGAAIIVALATRLIVHDITDVALAATDHRIIRSALLLGLGHGIGRNYR